MNATKKNATTATGPLLRLPDGESQEIEPDRLLLDPHNLRLLERADLAIQQMPVKLIGQAPIQKKVYSILANDSSMEIESLAKSITGNGFLRHERLIVCKFDGNKYIVLEGNRRLTAVRSIYEKLGPKLDGLQDYVRQSLRTLPCFVLEGESISGSEEILASYRRAAEIYIGMRHLMGAKSWDPAARYEFQHSLIFNEGWAPEQVAERFGRSKTEVLRDLKAQVLYNDFRAFEKKSNVEHTVTYNAFAEAARAPSVMKWLGWSNPQMTFSKKEHESSFFHYLLSRMRARERVRPSEGEDESPSESAEAVIRRLRDVLKLEDEAIQEALLDRDFDSADLLYEQKKEGDFAKRVASYTRALKRVTANELQSNSRENLRKLDELLAQVEVTIALTKTFSKK